MSRQEAELPEQFELQLIEQRLLALQQIGQFFNRGRELDRARFADSGEVTIDKVIHAPVSDEFIPVPSYRGVKEPRTTGRAIHGIDRLSVFVPADEVAAEGPVEVRNAFIILEAKDRREVRALHLLTAEASSPYVSAEDLIPELDYEGKVIWKVRPELAYDPQMTSSSEFEEFTWLTDLSRMLDTYSLRTLPTDDGDEPRRHAA